MRKLIALMMVACVILMTACQATPEKDIVIGKNLDGMIEKATKTDGPAPEQGKTLSEQVGASQTFEAELADPAGRVRIHVNADVQIPNTSGVTVTRVEQGKFTQQQIDTLIKNLMKGELFSGDDYKLTKSEIQQQIIQLEAAMQQNPVGNSGTDKRVAISDMRLQELKSQLETAPEKTTKVPSDGKLKPMSMEVDYSTGEKLYALANSENGDYESFRVYNYDDGASFLNYTSEKKGFAQDMGYFSPKEKAVNSMFPAEELAKIQEVTITKEDAQAQAEALISELGIEGLTCYSAEKMVGGSYERTVDQSAYVNPRKSVWFLRYVRNVNGVSTTYTPWDCIKVEEENQSAPWAYEDMTFAIDDTGIVGFSWRSPYVMSDTVTQNSNLISFDELTQVFNTMALAVNAWEGVSMGNPDLKAVDITINHVEFGLTRITEENKRNSGLLVPAWDFFGDMTYINEKDGKQQTFVDGPIPILTVNAIDGSIINRSLGY